MIYLLKKISVSFGLLLIIFMSIFGMMFFQHGGMGQKAQASMCPFMPDSTVVCKMTPMEHIEKWQNTFTSLPATDFLIAIALLFFSAVFVLSYKFLSSFLDPLVSIVFVRLRSRQVFRIPSPLGEAFSNGILNPKTF